MNEKNETNTVTNNHPPIKLDRNDFGLFDHVKYIYNEQGFVDWRKMVNSKYLVPNRTNFQKRGQEIPSSSEGLEDKDLLILLQGFKELAQLRGYKSIEYTLVPTSGSVLALCRIVWIENYETNGEEITFESTADAHSDNCNGFGKTFLTTVAENRAFGRAVRNFLQINILAQDEIGKDGAQEEQPVTVEKQDYLHNIREKIKSFNTTFEKVKARVLKDEEAKVKLPNAADWNVLEDVSKSDALYLYGCMLEWAAKKAKQKADEAKSVAV